MTYQPQIGTSGKKMIRQYSLHNKIRPSQALSHVLIFPKVVSERISAFTIGIGQYFPSSSCIGIGISKIYLKCPY